MNDNPKDENNTNEDMSLADLLGGGAESEEDAPLPVDHREDEPDSGMVNLAKMVADSSVEIAQTPSIAPPGASVAPASPQQSHVPPAATQAIAPKKRSSMPIVLGIVAIIAIALVAVLVIKNGDDDGKEAAALKAQKDLIAQMAAQMEAMKAQQTSTGNTDKDAEINQKMKELQAQLESAKAKEATLAQATAEEATEAVKKEESPKEAAKVESKSKKTKHTAKGKRAKSKTKPAAKTQKSSSEDILNNASVKQKKTQKNSKDELDSLLSGGKKKKEKSKAVAKSKSSEKPDKLTKADIKKAMQPVQKRAQKMCAKYSTGAVQVSITVGSNGRVKSAKPKGSFAVSKAGKCVAMTARTARFPSFKASKQTFLYPIILK